MHPYIIEPTVRVSVHTCLEQCKRSREWRMFYLLSSPGSFYLRTTTLMQLVPSLSNMNTTQDFSLWTLLIFMLPGILSFTISPPRQLVVAAPTSRQYHYYFPTMASASAEQGSHCENVLFIECGMTNDFFYIVTKNN